MKVPYTVVGRQGTVGQHIPYVVFLHGRHADHWQIHRFCPQAGQTDKMANYFRKDHNSPFAIFALKDLKNSYWKDMTEGPNVLNVINREFIQHIERHFSRSKKRCISGISMGGHGALYAALRSDDLYSCIYSMSPVFRSYSNVIDPSEPHYRDDLRAYGTSEEDFKKRDPYSMILSQDVLSQVPKDSVFVIGAEDPLLHKGNTTKFFSHMKHHGFAAEVISGHPGKPNGHDVTFWCDQTQKALLFFERHFKK